MMYLIDSFEGANIGRWNISANNTICVDLKKEDITVSHGQEFDYNLHFWFGIKNNATEKAEADIFVECEPGGKDLLKHSIIYSSGSVDGDYTPLDCGCRSDLGKKYRFTLSIGAGETIYVANTLPRNHSMLEALFPPLAVRTGAETRTIGKSIEGRDIRTYIYYNGSSFPTGKPVILITSGFHPPEPDTLVAEAIMEDLGTPEGKKMLDNCDVAVVPVVNPDGFFHGCQGANLHGTNIFWKFVTGDEKAHPESYYLFRFATAIMPAVYIDFHAYTFQMEGKSSGAYIRPECFYSGPRVRALADDITKDLISLNNGGHIEGTATYIPSTLGSMLNARFNTITFAKYHLHLKDGVERCRELGVDTLRIICAKMGKHNISSNADILLRPHGSISRDTLPWLKSRFMVFKYFHLLPFLRRTGIVDRA